MKKWFSSVAVVGMLLCLSFTTTHAQWKFEMVFPNSTLSWGSGLNNNIAVDPAGKVWVVPYSSSVRDTLIKGTDTMYVWHIRLYNPDGTLYKTYGPVLSLNGTPDTLFTPAAGYGMTTDHDGNIVIVKSSVEIRKINYQTGVEMAHVVNPIPGYKSSMTSPMLDDLNEAFITTVLPTTNVGPVALSSDFSSVLATVDTGMYGAYARNISVTPDGNDVYVHHIAKGTFHYHSDAGTLGTYKFVDTLWKALVIESSAWQPVTKYLWVSSGNIVSGMPDPPYSGYAWYGFDMTNHDKPVLKDSILWDGNTGISADSIKNDPRPRGIAFSPDGKIAYVAAFNCSQGFIQKFDKVTSVQRQPDVVVNSFSLAQNYPNPFNPSTQIKFSVAKAGFTTLKVFNILGEEVATLVSENLAAGSYSATFDASRLSSGTYLYVLTSGDQRLSNKMLLLK